MFIKAVKATMFGAALGAATLVAMPQAQASFLVSYTGVSAPGQISATALYSFTDVGTDVGLSLTLSNTSSATSQLVAYGFDTVGGTVTFSVTNGWNMVLNEGIGGPFGSFSVCIEADDNNNCPGNQPAAGISQGSSLTFSFVIDTALTAADYEAAMKTLHSEPIINNDSYHSAARFQAISGVSGVTSDRALPGTPTNPNPGPVPEPATLALFGMGLVGLGALARRRRRA